MHKLNRWHDTHQGAGLGDLWMAVHVEEADGVPTEPKIHAEYQAGSYTSMAPLRSHHPFGSFIASYRSSISMVGYIEPCLTIATPIARRQLSRQF